MEKTGIKWYKPLYTGDSLEDRQDEIIRMIEENRCSRSLRIITLASNGQDLLDIRHAAGWADRCMKGGQPPVVGIAGSRREALELVQRMAEECWTLQGNADLRSFFLRDKE